MLDDLLNTPQPPRIPSTQGGFVFTQEWSPDATESTVTASNLPSADNLDIVQFIRANGGQVPDGHTATILTAKYNPNAWIRETPYGDDGKKLPATTRGSWSYQFRIHPITTRKADIDELIKLAGRKPTRKKQLHSEVIFVYALGDTQLGKPDGDGTHGIIQRWHESLANAHERWTKAGKPPVLIAGLGDHLEGNQSQGGRNFYRSDLTVSEQLRLFRRMLLATVDTFIGASRIWVGIVNGNHDDIQRFQTTDASDGHATESAIAVADAMALNPNRYGHVSLYVPDKDNDHLVLECGGTNFVLIHGHQWSRGKAMEWWEKQTFNLHPASAGHILLHGHEHEFQISSRRDRLIITTPAMESESTWFKQKQGAVGRRGALIFTTQPGGHFQGMEIV